MHNLKELKIWHKAMELTTEVYRLTANFPKEEKYGLTSQIRRAAVSIPSNIAEGAGRNSNKEFVQFLAISNGSSYELQTQLLLSKNFNLIQEGLTSILDQIDQIQKNELCVTTKTFTGLISYLKTHI
jgi:four helix bundle protein